MYTVRKPFTIVEAVPGDRGAAIVARPFGSAMMQVSGG
jgi:hypothetical protein